jgi:hypothetical protein
VRPAKAKIKLECWCWAVTGGGVVVVLRGLVLSTIRTSATDTSRCTGQVHQGAGAMIFLIEATTLLGSQQWGLLVSAFWMGSKKTGRKDGPF